MKKLSLPKVGIHPWKGRDAGSTAARDWSVVFTIFLFLLLLTLAVQALEFYNLLSGKEVTTAETNEEVDDASAEIQEAHQIYQEKVRTFESQTGMRI